jgi:hypothetical protein
MTILNALTEFKLMPMKYLQLHDTVTGEDLQIHNLSVDSRYDFQSVNKRGGHGNNRTVGYLVTIVAVPVMTDLDNMLALLEPFRTNKANAFVWFEHEAGVHQRKGSLWLPSPVGVTWDPGKAEQRGQLPITITRALDSTYDYQTNQIFHFL